MYKPHKAENAELAKLKFPAIVLPKIDGVRGCFLTGQFTGRSLKPFKNKNITNYFSNPAYRGFDGELTLGGLTEEGLCRKTTGIVNSLAKNTDGEIPILNVFDWILPEIVFLPYKDRLELLTAYVEGLSYDLRQKIDIVPSRYLKTLEEVEADHQENILLGFEGTIVRLASAPHKNGRSTVKESAFMRIKEFLTAEGTITGYTEAQENWNPSMKNALGYTERSSHKGNKTGKGMIGALELLLPTGQGILCATGTMTHEERKNYWENPNYILGKTITFSYMPYGTYKAPRFAQFLNFRAEEDL